VHDPRTNAIVLDCQALSLLATDDRAMLARVEAARRSGARVLVSVLTIIEATGPKTDLARMRWVRSRLAIVPVVEQDADTAVQLLRGAGGLHGHRYAIDAAVAAMALRQPGRPTVVTSDPGDWARLCGDRVHIVPV